jgi:hypothetical protein
MIPAVCQNPDKEELEEVMEKDEGQKYLFFNFDL